MRPALQVRTAIVGTALSIALATATGPVHSATLSDAADVASTVIGANTGGTHNFGIGCGAPAGTPCEMTLTLQSAAAAHAAVGGATAPSPGVITSWSTSHGPLLTMEGGSATATSMTATLRVIRGAGSTGIGVGTGATEQLPQAPGTYTYPARLPVLAGDRIGYDLRFTPGNLALYASIVGSPGDVLGYSSIWPNGGSPGSYGSSTGGPNFVDAYLPITAKVEPDADADGYGDETQDLCPSNAGTQSACPSAPADTTPPRTTITKRPVKLSTRSTAKFRFSSSEPGSSFECALRGKGLPGAVKKFGPCETPRRYKGLAPGTYLFRVRAIDLAGNVDPTPAQYTFTVLD